MGGGTGSVPSANEVINFVIVTNGDDWEGVYRDGKLVGADHSIDTSTLKYLSRGKPFTVQRFEEQSAFSEYADETGQAPELLVDALDEGAEES